MKKIYLLLALFFIAFTPFSSAFSKKPAESPRAAQPLFRTEKADVILIATPIKVKTLRAGMTVDAVEYQPEELGAAKAVVVFRIEKVLMGEFTREKTGADSKWNQAREALDDKSFLKIVTMDFEDPEETFEKEWFSIAVIDPLTAFGIKAWDKPERKTKKIYLAQIPESPNSYVLLKSEEISEI